MWPRNCALFLLFSQSIWAQALYPEVDQQATHFGELSRKIWEAAEMGYQETRSSSLIKEELRKNGFHIEESISGIPTAFTARWGTGKPVIGILGEYDALPGLSQADVAVRKPVVDGASGHGCGHNLLGTGSALAAVAIRNWLEKTHQTGSIVFFWNTG